jgi:alpha-N-arabinofuranosidase
MTEPGGPAWRQTTFFPFALTAGNSHRLALRAQVESATVSTSRFGHVEAVEVAATSDPDSGALSIFLVNRSLSEPADVTIDLGPAVERFRDLHLRSALTLSDADIEARNTIDEPNRIEPKRNDSAVLNGGTITLTLPAVSWTMVLVAPGSD